MSAVEDNVSIPDISLSHLIFHSPYSSPHKTALVDGLTGAEVTYESLFEQARRFGAGLYQEGVREGDVVMLASGNSVRQVVCLLGVLHIKGLPAPVNPTFTPYELKSVMALTKARFWVLTSAVLPKLLQALEGMPLCVQKLILLQDETSPNNKNNHNNKNNKNINNNKNNKNNDDNNNNDNKIPNDPRIVTYQSLLQQPPFILPSFSSTHANKDTALILFSSGTTGMSKGVKISHRNLVFMLLTLTKGLYEDTFPSSLTPLPSFPHQTVTLAFLPYFHIFGLTLALLLPLFLRFKTVLFQRFDPKQVFSAIQRYKVNEMCMVPAVIQFMVEKAVWKERFDLSSLTTVNYGAGPCSKRLEDEFKRIYNIKYMFQGYGLTEVSLSALFILPSFPPKHGSAGKAFPFTQVSVKSVKTGDRLGANEVGEICVKGAQVMQGYLNNQEATKAAIDEEGCFHTGDVGYYDDEGYFFIVDRIKDMIKFKGFQVSPTEIENLLKTHSGVQETAVFGISHPKFGEIPKALVLKKQGCAVTKEEILNLVKANLSGYKQLRGGVEFVATLPMNASGKLLRSVLRERENKKEKGLLKSKM